MWTRAPQRRAGVTLVELIIAILIVGIAIGGLATVLARTSVASADPLILQQKVAIAESLMGEILLKPYAIDTGAITANVRDTYNDVRDFNGYGTGLAGIRDVANTSIAGLENYNVAVTVATATMTGMTQADALKITVAVAYKGEAAGDAFVLTGWRTAP
jgi:MSHA pilin protein MshD